jgi:hypothetical protein
MPRRFLLPLGLLVAAACGRDVVFVDPPPPSGHSDSTGSDTTGSDTTGTDTTTARRVDLSITVTVDPADTALATRLGMLAGRLSGAQVTATRFFGLQVPQTGATDSLGQLTLPRLIEGLWTIRVIRPLTAAERGQLDSANRDVTGFGGAYQDLIDAARSQVTFAGRAGRQGTLVISEAHMPVDNQITGYRHAQYIEVHNNSFDTLYLDGKILGRSIPWVRGTNTTSCEGFARWLEDPQGIWTRFLWAFPGLGRTYPLAPGASAIVATDAINHSVIHPQLLDLSGADFEFIGADGADVDNPAVPNMDEFPGFSNFGDEVLVHGPSWQSDISIFLADPVDPGTLVRDNLPVVTPGHVRVPRDKILDVLTAGLVPDQQTGTPYCPNFVHPSFDAKFAELVDNGSVTYSLIRQPIDAGLRLLQRTKVSAGDFVSGSPTPGQVP